jgi:antitoxin component of MazEF toxin-antitoxin module
LNTCLTRNIKTGKRPALYLPEDIIKATGLKVGDEVDIYLEGNRKIVIEARKE